MIVSVLLALFSWVGTRVEVASAAAIQCLPLSGDTSPIISATTVFDFGVGKPKTSYTSSNTGAMHFGEYAVGRPTLSPYNTKKTTNPDASVTYNPPQKAISYPPAANVACATKLNGTVYLQGWVWSDNLGWVSLYCPGDGTTNRGIACGGVKYGIQMNPVSGVFSGYAWSNAGWIRMNCAATAGYGDVNYCGASKHAVTLDVPSEIVKVPVAGNTIDFDDPNPLTPGVASAWAWTGSVQWMSFAGMKVPLAQLIDQNVNQNCIDNPQSCLGQQADVNGPDAPDVAPVVNNNPLVGDVGVPGQFPVGVREVAYLNNSPSASSALNPVTQAQVRNLVYRNVLKWKKVASTVCGDSGNFLLQYQTSDLVFYCKGDVHLKAGAKWKGNKTLIVEGGNVYVEGSLSGDKGQLGIVVIRSKLSDPAQGNVYVGPDVRDLHAQIYADGSVFPYVVGAPIGADGIPVITPANYAVVSNNNSLFGQLFIQGMIIANNYASTEGANLGGGADLGEQLRSLGYMRSSPGLPGPASDLAWSSYFDAWTKQQNKKISVAMSVDTDPVTYAFTFVNNTEGLKSYPYALAPNYINQDTDYKAVYMSYEPPAQDLPVFDGIVGSSLKQTGG